MKKKLLSLVMVLAMALTLLPTAAFAANCNHKEGEGTTMETAAVTEESAYDCTKVTIVTQCLHCTECGEYFTSYESADGTTPATAATSEVIKPTDGAAHSWTSGSCTNKVNSKPCTATHIPHAWTQKTGLCDTCGAACPNTSNHTAEKISTWTQTTTQHSKVCGTCGKEVVAAQNHDFGQDGKAATCSVCSYANPNAGGSPVEIEAVVITKPTNVTAGGSVSFVVASVNNNSNLANAVTVGAVTWKNAENQTVTAQSGQAPTTKGTYSAEIVVTAASGYILTPNSLSCS